MLEHFGKSKLDRSVASRTDSLEGSGTDLERVEGVDRIAVGPGGHGLQQGGDVGERKTSTGGMSRVNTSIGPGKEPSPPARRDKKYRIR